MRNNPEPEIIQTFAGTTVVSCAKASAVGWLFAMDMVLALWWQEESDRKRPPRKFMFHDAARTGSPPATVAKDRMTPISYPPYLLENTIDKRTSLKSLSPAQCTCSRNKQNAENKLLQHHRKANESPEQSALFSDEKQKTLCLLQCLQDRNWALWLLRHERSVMRALTSKISCLWFSALWLVWRLIHPFTQRSRHCRRCVLFPAYRGTKTKSNKFIRNAVPRKLQGGSELKLERYAIRSAWTELSLEIFATAVFLRYFLPDVPVIAPRVTLRARSSCFACIASVSNPHTCFHESP